MKLRSLLVSFLALGALTNSGCDSSSSSGTMTSGGSAGASGSANAAGATSTAGVAATGGSAGASGAQAGTGSGGAPPETEVPTPTEPVSAFIVVDQFGYLPDSEKVAVLRDPEMGFDAAESYTPGAKYQLIDAATKAVVSELTASAWNGGAVDPTSGDRAWRVDFSAVKTPGVYYLLDVDAKVRSDVFRIAEDVYRLALRHAFRTFFYQRAGFEKKAEFAGEAWADGASHLGAGQDKNARLFGQTGDATTERDLSGGWYDAGDYNRYTAWTAEYIVTLLRM
jgi:hypothetical protein